MVSWQPSNESSLWLFKRVIMSPVVSLVLSLVLSLVERTIKRDLADMQKKGVLIREGNTSAGHWVLLIDKAE